MVLSVPNGYDSMPELSSFPTAFALDYRAELVHLNKDSRATRALTYYVKDSNSYAATVAARFLFLQEPASRMPMGQVM